MSKRLEVDTSHACRFWALWGASIRDGLNNKVHLDK